MASTGTRPVPRRPGASSTRRRASPRPGSARACGPSTRCSTSPVCTSTRTSGCTWPGATRPTRSVRPGSRCWRPRPSRATDGGTSISCWPIPPRCSPTGCASSCPPWWPATYRQNRWTSLILLALRSASLPASAPPSGCHRSSGSGLAAYAFLALRSASLPASAPPSGCHRSSGSGLAAYAFQTSVGQPPCERSAIRVSSIQRLRPGGLRLPEPRSASLPAGAPPSGCHQSY